MLFVCLFDFSLLYIYLEYLKCMQNHVYRLVCLSFFLSFVRSFVLSFALAFALSLRAYLFNSLFFLGGWLLSRLLGWQVISLPVG